MSISKTIDQAQYDVNKYLPVHRVTFQKAMLLLLLLLDSEYQNYQVLINQ